MRLGLRDEKMLSIAVLSHTLSGRPHRADDALVCHQELKPFNAVLAAPVWMMRH
jgi:hypothetical protein